jgi:ribosomal protein S18 acetylase RimI-like enzyme
MPAVTISTATEQDLFTLNKMMFDLHQEHHLACPDHFKTAEVIAQEGDKEIADYLNHPECLVYVAKQNNEVIGFITGHFCELISAVSKPVLMGSVDEFYVLPCYRNQSVGQQLLARIERELKNYGVVQLFVEVWDFNQKAQQFYQQVGFDAHIHWLRKPL